MLQKTHHCLDLCSEVERAAPPSVHRHATGNGAEVKDSVGTLFPLCKARCDELKSLAHLSPALHKVEASLLRILWASGACFRWRQCAFRDLVLPAARPRCPRAQDLRVWEHPKLECSVTRRAGVQVCFDALPLGICGGESKKKQQIDMLRHISASQASGVTNATQVTTVHATCVASSGPMFSSGRTVRRCGKNGNTQVVLNEKRRHRWISRNRP